MRYAGRKVFINRLVNLTKTTSVKTSLPSCKLKQSCLRAAAIVAIAEAMTSPHHQDAVHRWLRSLQLDNYFESFIDNGYDDLDVCQMIGAADLEAIGVWRDVDKSTLLQAVRVLRVNEDTAPVYFTLEEMQDNAKPDNERRVMMDAIEETPSPKLAGGSKRASLGRHCKVTFVSCHFCHSKSNFDTFLFSFAFI